MPEQDEQNDTTEQDEQNDTTEQESVVQPDPDLDSFEGKAAPYHERRRATQTEEAEREKAQP